MSSQPLVRMNTRIFPCRLSQQICTAVRTASSTKSLTGSSTEGVECGVAPEGDERRVAPGARVDTSER